MLIKTHKVSPAWAEKMLNEKNNKNRNLRDALVDHYADQMNKGNWLANGEAIKIAKDGTLLDGQHRLAAVVKHGKPVEMLIINDIDPSVMPTIDIGKPRTVADHLRIEGTVGGDATVIAAAVRLAIGFIAGNGTYTESRTVKRTSPTDTINFVHRHRGIIRSAHQINQYDKNLKKMVPPAVLCAMHFLFAQIDTVKTEAFFIKLSTGEDLKRGDPILVLRSQLIAMRQESRRNRFNQKVFMYYFCKAFEYFLYGHEALQPYKYNPSTMKIELPTKDRKRVKK